MTRYVALLRGVSPKGPGFMGLLERTFGKAITTRTLDTVRKCALA